MVKTVSPLESLTTGFAGLGGELSQSERERIDAIPDPLARLRARRTARAWTMRANAIAAERADDYAEGEACFAALYC